MGSILRVVALYGFLLVVFRLSGKRTLGESSRFDLLMLLIISETTQEALIGDDHSLINALTLILTFVLMDVGLSLWKQRSQRFEKILEGTPVVVVSHGRPLQQRMDKLRVGEDDILEAAREFHGLERMDQVKYAVVERSGVITIIPGTRRRKASRSPS
jgi:uncharacterized membrane protein YcaP (DUF421 family)